MIDPCQLLLGIGCVAGDEEKARIFQGNQPPFRVQLRDAQPIGDGKGRFLGKDGGAGIPLFLSGIPELGIARGIQLNLAGLKLGFLQTEEICVRFPEKFRKPLGDAGTQAVYIPGDQFHRELLSIVLCFGGGCFQGGTVVLKDQGPPF